MTRLGEISKNMRKFLYLEEESDMVLIHVCIVDSLELVVFLSDSSSRALGTRWREERGTNCHRRGSFRLTSGDETMRRNRLLQKALFSNCQPKPDLILLRSNPKFPLRDVICFASVRHNVSQAHSASVLVPLPKTMLPKL